MFASLAQDPTVSQHARPDGTGSPVELGPLRDAGVRSDVTRTDRSEARGQFFVSVVPSQSVAFLLQESFVMFVFTRGPLAIDEPPEFLINAEIVGHANEDVAISRSVAAIACSFTLMSFHLRPGPSMGHYRSRSI